VEQWTFDLFTDNGYLHYCVVPTEKTPLHVHINNAVEEALKKGARHANPCHILCTTEETASRF
jgi:hypothetical protein